MYTAYVVVTLMAVAASALVAVANFMRLESVLSTAANLGVPESRMTTLGALNAAAAIGLLLGLLGVPLIGTVPPSASSCTSSAPSSPTCAYATTRSVRRPRSSCWPRPRWCWI